MAAVCGFGRRCAEATPRRAELHRVRGCPPPRCRRRRRPAVRPRRPTMGDTVHRDFLTGSSRRLRVREGTVSDRRAPPELRRSTLPPLEVPTSLSPTDVRRARSRAHGPDQGCRCQIRTGRVTARCGTSRRGMCRGDAMLRLCVVRRSLRCRSMRWRSAKGDAAPRAPSTPTARRLGGVPRPGYGEARVPVDRRSRYSRSGAKAAVHGRVPARPAHGFLDELGARGSLDAELGGGHATPLTGS
jgi:hypothetical protein